MMNLFSPLILIFYFPTENCLDTRLSGKNKISTLSLSLTTNFQFLISSHPVSLLILENTSPDDVWSANPVSSLFWELVILLLKARNDPIWCLNLIQPLKTLIEIFYHLSFNRWNFVWSAFSKFFFSRFMIVMSRICWDRDQLNHDHFGEFEISS